MPKKCLNHPDNCSYVFGDLTFKSQRQNITPFITKCFERYFGCKVGHQHKSWAPHICCLPCVRFLIGWVNGSRQIPLRGTKRPLVRSLIPFNEHSRDHLQIETHGEMSRFVICKEVCPTQWVVSCTKAYKTWLLATKTLILMKITGSKEGKMLIATHY